MGRRRPARRPFSRGEEIEVRRVVGAAWEVATYVKPIAEMRGWHSVKLSQGAPRTIDMTTFMDLEEGSDRVDGRSYTTTHHAIIPTQRTRPRRIT